MGRFRCIHLLSVSLTRTVIDITSCPLRLEFAVCSAPALSRTHPEPSRWFSVMVATTGREELDLYKASNQISASRVRSE
jgi:hypothetical protein